MVKNVALRILLIVLGVLYLMPAKAKTKINVLLLSGSNNHNWEETSPVLINALETSGLFTIRVTENPDTLNEALLRGIDVVVSNWNTFPQLNSSWDRTTQNRLMNFVKKGGGFVFIHAASSVHYNWKEFQEMAGATWKMKKTRHGKVAPLKVAIKNEKHPITLGLSDFWTTDELWVNIEIFGTANVLAEAFALKTNKGRDRMEPVLFEQQIGQGRSVYLVLGHHKQAMRNLGFQTLLLRSAEWAATGKVNQTIPLELCAEKTPVSYKFKRNKNSVTLKQDGEAVWKFNFNRKEGKPYFHPLKTSAGTALTWLRPKDHPWHRALWFSLKYINGVNYWEEDRESGLSEGKTVINDVQYKLDKKNGATFNIDLSYQHKGNVLLQENRNVMVSIPDKEGAYFIDWQSSFTALEDEVILDRTPILGEIKGKIFRGYAGLSIRLNKNLWNIKTFNDSQNQDKLHGSEAKYLTLQGRDLKGKDFAITVLDHPNNYNYPSKWYVEQNQNIPFNYLSPAFLFSEKKTLKKQETFKLRYRILIYPGAMSVPFIKAHLNTIN